MEAGQVRKAALTLVDAAKAGQSGQFEGASDIADAVENGGYGQSWLFTYQGVKDTTPRWRVATLLPPIGDKPTLVEGSHLVGFDPLAVCKRTGQVGGLRHFKFLNMGGATPVEGDFSYTPE